MKITKKMVSFIILAVGIIALLLSYNLVFTSNKEKIETAEKEIKKLEERYDELKGLAMQQTRFKKGTTEENAKQAIITSLFPASIPEENKIMFIDDVETSGDIDIFFSSVNYGSPKQISVFNDNVLETGFAAYEVIMSASFEGTYEGVNRFIDYVNNLEERAVVNNISMAFNASTGLLSGTVNMTFYYIEGLDCEYNVPYIPEIDLGRDNIFGTLN